LLDACCCKNLSNFRAPSFVKSTFYSPLYKLLSNYPPLYKRGVGGDFSFLYKRKVGMDFINPPLSPFYKGGNRAITKFSKNNHLPYFRF